MSKQDAQQGIAQEAVGSSAAQSATIHIQIDPLAQFLSQPNKPSFYANGFQAGLTPSECYMIFNQNNLQKVAITIPIPTIKTLRETLERMEKDYEEKFGTKIKSIQELNDYKNSGKK